MAGRSRDAVLRDVASGLRHLVREKELTIRGASRHFGLSRNTVRRIVRYEWRRGGLDWD